VGSTSAGGSQLQWRIQGCERLTKWTLGRPAAAGEEKVLLPRNGDQVGGLVLAEADTSGGVSDLADEGICKVVGRRGFRNGEMTGTKFRTWRQCWQVLSGSVTDDDVSTMLSRGGPWAPAEDFEGAGWLHTWRAWIGSVVVRRGTWRDRAGVEKRFWCCCYGGQVAMRLDCAMAWSCAVLYCLVAS
jgi:hypothetical protein